jgi:hypothetical protein
MEIGVVWLLFNDGRVAVAIRHGHPPCEDAGIQHRLPHLEFHLSRIGFEDVAADHIGAPVGTSGLGQEYEVLSNAHARHVNGASAVRGISHRFLAALNTLD